MSSLNLDTDAREQELEFNIDDVKNAQNGLGTQDIERDDFDQVRRAGLLRDDLKELDYAGALVKLHREHLAAEHSLESTIEHNQKEIERGAGGQFPTIDVPGGYGLQYSRSIEDDGISLDGESLESLKNGHPVESYEIDGTRYIIGPAAGNLQYTAEENAARDNYGIYYIEHNGSREDK